MQRTIELSDEQLQELERLASTERRSLEELVQVAVDDYLARRTRDWSNWNHQFDAFVQDVRSRIPPGVTPEEIEEAITAARAEVRAERAAQRTTPAGADAGGR